MVTGFTDWNSGLYLAHHGIRGMKWGVRRYQNEDGTLTEAGKNRLRKENYKTVKKLPRDSQFMSKARSMIPNDKMQELLDVKKKHNEASRTMTKFQSAEDYRKPGGVQSKIEEIANETFGKKWRKLGYSTVNHIIDGAANETLEGAFRKAAFNNFKNALNSKGSKKERNEKIWASLNHEEERRVIDHILQNKKANRMISDFWKKKTSKAMSATEFDRTAKQYAQQLARQLGLPESKVTYYFLREWFFNGDD